MGRLPSGKPRKSIRLPKEHWEILNDLATKNHRTRDLQLEAIIEDWLYFTTKGYGPQVEEKQPKGAKRVWKQPSLPASYQETRERRLAEQKDVGKGGSEHK